MKILLVSATRLEMDPLLEKLNHTYPHLKVDVLIAGVGTLHTSYQLTKALAQKTYDLCLQGGIAGTFQDFNQVEVFWIQQEAFVDTCVKNEHQISKLKVSENQSLMDGLSQDAFYTNPHFTKLIGTLKIKTAKAITSNTLLAGSEANQLRNMPYQAQLESMEGAAFFHVCLKENVPFISIRATSNAVGERNHENWKTQEAVEVLCSKLDEILQHFDNKDKQYES